MNMFLNAQLGRKISASLRSKISQKLISLKSNYGLALLHCAVVVIASSVAYGQSSSSQAKPSPSAAHPSSTQMMGTGTCSSSNCHGSVNPRTATPVLQNEYYTWTKYDRHAEAYKVLGGEDSRRIASLMGIGDPTQAPECLKCHSTVIPPNATAGQKFQVEDGVSCEACHGAASGWLESHSTNSGATAAAHKENIANGMTDLDSISGRATLCLSCHYGNDNQTVNHKLYGAGHPRLSFELDTFSALQPRHWNVDDDYISRKTAYLPARAWLVGQAVQARETLKALKSPTRSKDGIFPEPSLFGCSSCHHSLTEDQWKRRGYGGKPGGMRLNLPSLTILRETTKAFAPNASARLGQYLDAINTNYHRDGANSAITALGSILDREVIPQAEAISNDRKKLLKLISSLSNFCSGDLTGASQWPTYEIAEQVSMGISAAVASSTELTSSFQGLLDQMTESLPNPEAFQPEKFVATCRRIRALAGTR